MALSTISASAQLSLEDELAEATQDLLHLGHSSSQSTQSTFGAPLPSPSPLLLSRPSSARLDVDKALAIDPKARLTPINDDDNGQPPALAPDVSQRLSDKKSDHGAASMLAETSLPDSHLHRTMKSVSSSALLLPGTRQRSAHSPRLQAAQEGFRGHSWLNERGECVVDGRVERKMDLLLNKARQGSTLGAANLTAEARRSVSMSHQPQDNTPAFFLESFPDVKSRMMGSMGGDSAATKAEEPTDNAGPSSPRRPTTTGLSNARSHFLPFMSTAPQPSAATATAAAITVKLHGNRRAEREALLSAQDEEVEDHDATLASLDPFSSSPIEEIDRQTVGDDTGSLLSLPATTATSSSHTSSARRRRSLRRRRSAGSQSHLTGVSDEADYQIPFARDVNIRGFSVVGERSRGYVAYDVRIVTRTGSTISILRRFSSFVNLRKALMIECGPSTSARTNKSASTAGAASTVGTVPPLPPRRTGLLQKYAANHLEKRRRALQRWLGMVMLDPTWGASRSLRQWVVGSEEDV